METKGTDEAYAEIKFEFFGDPDDFSTAAREQAYHEAYWFLFNHPLFRIGDISSFPNCLKVPPPIPAHQVNPETRKTQEDQIGHYIKIECGYPMEVAMMNTRTACYERHYANVLDPRLTAISRSFEDAIIKLAGNVLLCYGDSNSPRLPR